MASKKFLVNLDLSGNLLNNARIMHGAADPAVTGSDAGFIFFNTTDKELKVWDGGNWITSTVDFSLLSGDVTSTAAGVVTIEDDAIITQKIIDGAVTNAKMADMASKTFKGNASAGAAAPQDLTVAEMQAELGINPGGGELNEKAELEIGSQTTTTMDINSSVASSAGAQTDSVTLPQVLSGGNAGLMSGADKLALDTLVSAPGTGALSITNDSGPLTNAAITVTLSDGVNPVKTHTIPLATNNHAGLMDTGQQSKLNNIEAEATKVVKSEVVYRNFTSTTDPSFTSLSAIAWVTADAAFASSTDELVPTALAVKTYVDGKVAGNSAYQGSYDAAGDSPHLDSGTIVTGLHKGDYYVVTVAGEFFGGTAGGGIDLAVSDTIIANKVDPTVFADWDIVHRTINVASTTVQGETFLATDAEAIAATEAGNKAIVPTSLKAALEAPLYGGSSTTGNARRYSFEVTGDGSTSSWVINHALGKREVVVQVYESTGANYEEVITGVQRTDDNNVQIDINNNLANNDKLTVVVVG